MHRKNILLVLFALISGLLPIAVFAPYDEPMLIWIAWVPLILLARHLSPRFAFLLTWLAGTTHWLASLRWLYALVPNGGPLLLITLGHLALSTYLGLYWGLFGYTNAKLRQQTTSTPLLLALSILLEPLLWIATEYLRGFFFTGFPWNCVGVSLPSTHTLAQLASYGGVFIVALPVFLINGLFATIVHRIWNTLMRAPYQRATMLSLVPILLFVFLHYLALQQAHSVMNNYSNSSSIRIAYTQTNQSCVEHDASKFKNLLEQANRIEVLQPDLWIWPESALYYSLPDPFPISIATRASKLSNATILTGCSFEEQPKFYNSAALFSPNSLSFSAIRHKRHLVPFGEYIPGDKLIPPLQKLVPTGSSCTPGTNTTPFDLTIRGKSIRMAPLICYEDIYPYLARQNRRAGANLLVNLSNDNWFNNSIEPIQHYRQSAYRAIETGIPLVRACNGGVSALILPTGQVSICTSDGNQVTGFSAYGVWTVPVLDNPPLTPYVQYGDLLCAWPALIILLVVLTWPQANRVIRQRTGN